MATVAERLSASLREITQPLVNQLREVELEIKVREDELKELRDARTKLVTIARQIDPELAPKKQTKQHVEKGVGQETLDAVHSWFLERKDEINANGGVHASGIHSREDFDLTSKATLNKVMLVLHAHGLLRLDHTGSGGAKFYKVVA